MIKYYADSEEKYLKSVLLYAITNEVDGESITQAYYDPDGNKPVYNDDMPWEDMFIKGLITFCLILPNVRNVSKPASYNKAKITGRLSFTLVGFQSPIEITLFSNENAAEEGTIELNPGLGGSDNPNPTT